jgi:hypothetical protein
MVSWESDYPHPDSTWPYSPESAYKALQHLDDGVIDKITHRNAMRMFAFDPFAHRSRESSTVGALRAEAAGRDTTLVPGKQVQLAERSQGEISRSAATANK